MLTFLRDVGASGPYARLGADGAQEEWRVLAGPRAGTPRAAPAWWLPEALL